jgi:phosphatidylglycerol lysyltransferase
MNALSQGSWRWLLLALAIQAVYYCIITLMTRSAFRVVHLDRKFLETLPLVFGALFVNVLAPTGGQTGTILFADDAARRNESSPKAVIASVIATVVSYMAFSIILIFSLFYLKRANLLNNYEVVGSIIFIFPTVIPSVLIFSSHRYPKFTLRVLDWIYRWTVRLTKLFRRKIKPNKDWAQKIADELTEASTLVLRNRKKLLITFILALVAYAINIISLFVIFEAFELRIHYGALIAGFAFGEVARIVSPQPEGIGVVEVAMAVIFTSFGVPPIQATAIAIIFRGFNFWLPLGIGFFLLRRLKTFSPK